jgi:hypothetical protein
MSKRLQVLIPDREMLEVQRLARSERMTVAEWVRRTLREACIRKPATNSDTKLKTVRKAAGFEFPTADIDAMLDDIERG